MANQKPGNGISEVVELPRRAGAPKGRAKPEGSGRQKGTRNRVTKEIAEIAQKHGKAIVDGLVKEFKTTDDLDVKVKIASLVLSYGYGQPTRRSEVSGPGGQPIETTRTLIRDDRELGRRLALALNRAMPTEIAGEAEVIDATPAAPPVNGTEARLLPGDTIDGLRITKAANGAHKPTLPPEESPAEYELLAPPRSDQLPSPPLLPEARRGHEAKRRRP